LERVDEIRGLWKRGKKKILGRPIMKERHPPASFNGEQKKHNLREKKKYPNAGEGSNSI